MVERILGIILPVFSVILLGYFSASSCWATSTPAAPIRT
jgi:predicted permease